MNCIIRDLCLVNTYEVFSNTHWSYFQREKHNLDFSLQRPESIALVSMAWLFTAAPRHLFLGQVTAAR